jgi:uncharacterized membrane protein YidH (DUF202 family)
MSGESEPLNGGNTKSFYFLTSQKSFGKDAAQTSTPSELIPDIVEPPPSRPGFMSNVWDSLSFRRKDRAYSLIEGQDSAMNKPRKVPVKIEPKVFFANERTFLAWLHMSVTLASISVAIVAFAESNEWSQIYGLLLMPVAISFCCYSLYMYTKRANMIRNKEPGPYEDKFGPTALAIMLGLAILVNFCVKLFDYTR